jgi:uncharacterized protein (TIGR02246 family)
MEVAGLRQLATSYTAAWCSQDPDSVASHFAADGSLTINDGTPAVGRRAIADSAAGFMTAFPDLTVTMDALEVHGSAVVYRWKLTGTNTGPGGTGRSVTISGREEWTMGADGLVAESRGWFDQDAYLRQLQHGEDSTPR